MKTIEEIEAMSEEEQKKYFDSLTQMVQTARQVSKDTPTEDSEGEQVEETKYVVYANEYAIPHLEVAVESIMKTIWLLENSKGLRVDLAITPDQALEMIREGFVKYLNAELIVNKPKKVEEKGDE